MPESCRLIALGWDRPLLETVVERILGETASAEVLPDFGDRWFLLPTAEAGRQLREALALHSPRGVTNLQILLPDQLLTEEQPAATEARRLNVWIAVLRQYARRCPALFKTDTLANHLNDCTYLLGIAAKLEELRQTLARDGRSLSSVFEELKRLAKESPLAEELERHEELLQLESAYYQQLGHQNDPVFRQLQRQLDPRVPAEIKQVILIGCHALRGAVVTALHHLPVPVESWIAAPETELSHFDSFGNIDTNYWQTRPLPFDAGGHVRRFADSTEQAAKIRQLLRNQEFRPSVIGVLDPEITRLLEDTLSEEFRFYSPERRPLATLPWTRFYRMLLEFARPENPPFSLAAALARNIRILDYLKADERLAASLDQLQSDHLILDFASLRRFSREHHRNAEFALKKLSEPMDVDDNAVRSTWSRADCCQRFVELLEHIHQKLHKSTSPARCAFELMSEIGGSSRPMTRRELENGNQELDMLAKIAVEADLPGEVELGQAILQRQLSTTMLDLAPDEDPAIDLAGFLELPWRPDSTLLIAGFNEESFHYGNGSDLFLPDRLREKLQLTSRRDLYAADAFTFCHLLHSRRGNLYLLYGKGSSAGDVLHPSRLLTQCSAEELPTRLELLYGGACDEKLPPPAINPAAKFPPYRLPQRSFSGRNMPITGFKTYLECPFRFYRERVLRLEVIDDRNIEFDALRFGTLVHGVLERYGRARLDGVPLKDRQQELESHLSALLDSQFNQVHNGLTDLQLGFIRNNLTSFAEKEAESAAEGWQIVKVEEKINFIWQELYQRVFPGEPPEQWRSQIAVTGKLDRLDERRDPAGTLLGCRVIDYKTNRNALSPNSEHLSGGGGLSEEEKQARSSSILQNNREKYWTDLQLPLYAAIARHLLHAVPDELPVEAAYFNLPLAGQDAGIANFPEVQKQEVIRSAVACADYVLKAIYVDQRFWPPKVRNNQYDPFLERTGELRLSDYLEPLAWENE